MPLLSSRDSRIRRHTLNRGEGGGGGEKFRLISYSGGCLHAALSITLPRISSLLFSPLSLRPHDFLQSRRFARILPTYGSSQPPGEAYLGVTLVPITYLPTPHSGTYLAPSEYPKSRI